MKEVIVFDLSGVFFNDGLTVAINKISSEYSLDEDKVRYVLNGDFSSDYRKGLLASKDFWLQAQKYLGLNDYYKIKNIFFDAYTINEDVLKLILNLKKNNTVSFISNSPGDRVKFLNKKHNFLSAFNFGLFSYEANVLKPDIEIFHKFLQKFQLDPKKIIYIDDILKNLESPKDLGMNTILYKNVQQLTLELDKLGISFK